jgi:hypothetical protein
VPQSRGLVLFVSTPIRSPDSFCDFRQKPSDIGD